MSGAEVLGIISGVIAIIDGVTKVSGALKDSHGLPEAFREVHKRLPLVHHILNELKEKERSGFHSRSLGAMIPTLESCREKAERLEVIFHQVLPQPEDLRKDRYLRAIRTLGRGSNVETLMEGILADCQLLIGLRSLDTVSKDQMAELTEAIGHISTMTPSASERVRRGMTYTNNYNTGTGTQHINSGIGTQINNLGSGSQYNGPITQYYRD
jgi:hypothetical protein